jgi:hypothetical protein
MISQLTSITASQQRADLLAAADRSRLVARASQPKRIERPRRIWHSLRRRPAVA